MLKDASFLQSFNIITDARYIPAKDISPRVQRTSASSKLSTSLASLSSLFLAGKQFSRSSYVQSVIQPLILKFITGMNFATRNDEIIKDLSTINYCFNKANSNIHFLQQRVLFRRENRQIERQLESEEVSRKHHDQ